MRGAGGAGTRPRPDTEGTSLQQLPVAPTTQIINAASFRFNGRRRRHCRAGRPERRTQQIS